MGVDELFLPMHLSQKGHEPSYGIYDLANLGLQISMEDYKP